MRAANRLATEAPKDRKARLERERAAQSRAQGAHEPGVSTRSQKRRADGTHEPDLAARPQKRRVGCTHEPGLAARPQKRRVDGTHEPGLAARPQKRRVDGAHEFRDEAERARKRREGGARKNAGARYLRHQPPPTHGSGEGNKEMELRKLCYVAGVAYVPAGLLEPSKVRDQRRDRVRLLARRTGRGPGRRDKGPMEERGIAVGVNRKDPSIGSEALIMRANKNDTLSRQEEYLATHAVPPHMPASPPPDTPGGMRFVAESELAFERAAGEFSLSVHASHVRRRD